MSRLTLRSQNEGPAHGPHNASDVLFVFIKIHFVELFICNVLNIKKNNKVVNKNKLTLRK